ncbi:M23 family metallopeptidase [Phormidium tenue FACHB-886]|nr:M23 family metallopeptidase [Phormidium tenue FACHB-886]
MGVGIPKSLESLVAGWFHGRSGLPLEMNRQPLSVTLEASPADGSLLPEDSYIPTQFQIDSTVLPSFIKLTRGATKLTSLPQTATQPTAKSVAAPSNQASDYWRTIATNCGGLESANAQQTYVVNPAVSRQLTGSNMIFPLPIPAQLTSGFGWRIHPIRGDRRFHPGIDLGAPYGTPVLSALAGRVVEAGEMGGYGLAVIVEAASGQQQNLYAHLSTIAVKPGDQVQQGSVLGLVGSTGSSTGPHLHFETLLPTTEGWTAVDPLAAVTLAAASQ